MKILVVGAGIAGPTLAFWLQRAGYELTLVERAPELRRGGYLVDFWGAGFDVADRMGIAPEILRRGYHMAEVRQVGDDGHRITAFDPELFVRGTSGRYVSIARSELGAILYGALGGRVETIFGDSVRALDDDGNRVRVTFDSGTTRDFDLVIGTDGPHQPSFRGSSRRSSSASARAPCARICRRRCSSPSSSAWGRRWTPGF